MDPTTLSIVVFLSIAGFVGVLMMFFLKRDATRAEDRLDVLMGQKTEATATKAELLRETAESVGGFFGRLTEKLGNFPLLFEQADAPIKIETFFIITAGMAGLGVLIGVVTSPFVLIPIYALALGVLPLFWLLFRRRKRFKKFAKQLPDALELVGRALRSGHSLSQGLHVVVEEMPAPISEEFGKAYEEQNLGVPIELALKHMLRRMPNMDLKFFVTAVTIQRQAGGDLSEILDKISYLIRERFKILGQVMALTGEGRISGIVLMVLPIALFFAVYHLNREYVMLLFTEETGRKMIAYAAFMQVLGAISIKKIVNIKV